MSGAAKAWAGWEDRLLTVHYPDKGPDGLAPLLPRRSRIAIIRQACRLGVRWKTHPTTRTWPATDMAVLAEHYPKSGSKGVHKLLPHRTLAAIRVMARKHGIYCHGPRKVQPSPLICFPEARLLTFADKLALVEQGKASIVPALVRYHLIPRIAA